MVLTKKLARVEESSEETASDLNSSLTMSGSDSQQKRLRNNINAPSTSPPAKYPRSRVDCRCDNNTTTTTVNNNNMGSSSNYNNQPLNLNWNSKSGHEYDEWNNVKGSTGKESKSFNNIKGRKQQEPADDHHPDSSTNNSYYMSENYKSKRSKGNNNNDWNSKKPSSYSSVVSPGSKYNNNFQSYNSNTSGGSRKGPNLHDRNSISDGQFYSVDVKGGGGSRSEPYYYCPPNQAKPVAVLFMGLPGSGKTTLKQKRYDIGLYANSYAPRRRIELANQNAFVDVSADKLKKGIYFSFFDK